MLHFSTWVNVGIEDRKFWVVGVDSCGERGGIKTESDSVGFSGVKTLNNVVGEFS